VTTKAKKSLPAWLPFVIGAVLVVQFAGLSVWQINRGLEKRANRAAFADRSTVVAFRDGEDVRAYQSIKTDGRFSSGQQFLLDNIILNSRYGYYVLTALEMADDEPLLIVNRGWIQKSAPNPDLAAISTSIAVVETPLTVRGRVGSLPRPGVRMGDAILPQESWPRIAVFPTTEDLAASLGREVQPFVLLMDPDDDHGFLRHWVPEEMGPGKHFGYALQWFAMGVVLAGLLIFNFRKQRLG
jgi:cytochrome oxidase assembly protein ShyY1